jgi:hypothetical protein
VIVEGPGALKTKFINIVSDGKLPENEEYGIPELGVGHLTDWQLEMAEKSSRALGGDPPRDDYDVVAEPDYLFSYSPLSGSDYVSPVRARLINGLMTSLWQLNVNLDAAAVSLDRYAGASASNDLKWASQQARAMLYFEGLAAEHARASGMALGNLLSQLRERGFTEAVISADAVKRYQKRIRKSLDAPARAAGAIVRASEADMEAHRLKRASIDPASVSGPLFAKLDHAASDLMALSEVLQRQGEVLSSSGRSKKAAQRSLGDWSTSLRIGNPQRKRARIDLSIRAINVPPDWSISVEPPSVSLRAGENTTAWVHVHTTSPAFEDTRPRAAVEGRIGRELVSGSLAVWSSSSWCRQSGARTLASLNGGPRLSGIRSVPVADIGMRAASPTQRPSRAGQRAICCRLDIGVWRICVREADHPALDRPRLRT